MTKFYFLCTIIMTGYYLARIASVSFAIFTFYLEFFLPESIKHNGRLFLSKYNESETKIKKVCCVLKGAIPQKEMVRLLHELFNLP